MPTAVCTQNKTVRYHQLSSFWTSCGLRGRPFPPPGTCLQIFSIPIGFSIPTARRLSSNVANSRSRNFRQSTCAQEKSPPMYTSFLCTWGDSNSLSSPTSIAGSRNYYKQGRGDRFPGRCVKNPAINSSNVLLNKNKNGTEHET